MNNKRGLSEEIREELRAKYEPVAEEKRNNGNKSSASTGGEELLRMLEAMRYLCRSRQSRAQASLITGIATSAPRTATGLSFR